ncbi:iron-sulfur cluster biosynthesis family protein [Fictibacillus barbaricus]|uniref:Iron-sulfur cluster biosynthesis family protein n=1 Tax=Fictibacillus barbaricus TaxID=182136 RepID=A0ABS2Z7U5_9BACL|nr:iron-sulfur cluster biosynthesis family protein [Fictibacillus barbaricus]MBN3544147.1 iron-sulfur cluster biosynthesis family protein [Fictibacillus barbaricus]GGB69305.1 hypothetical protein GCM10007199_39400 [Fictibacillus barbaricus]
MNIKITDSAREAMKGVKPDQLIQLSLDRGSCDIVNNIYEMKVIPLRPVKNYEKILNVDDFKLLIDEDFEEVYQHELMIDHVGGSFVFKNKNQIFNNKIKIRFL